tara:strand:- start:2114 stop:2668 length:555 start_codon:yes stop_codon:yes gene_type:complete
MLKNNFIQIFSGRQFYPLEPRVEDVDIKDIAHALAMKCRFNGHCLKFYSIAEHSVRVANLLEEDGYIAPIPLWGLIHDAGEAYLADVPRPIKKGIPFFNELETKVLNVIVEALGIDRLELKDVKILKNADNVLLATEKRDLMGEPPAKWMALPHPLACPICPLSPELSEIVFMEKWEDFTGAKV